VYNFWLFKVLINGMMIPILDYIHSLTGSYGLAIVALTVVIRGLIFPLSMKQYGSMKAMQVLQPKLKELQAQYKDNPAELNKAVMAFYQEHKVNPLGGCLPLVIQMPFLIALYGALYSADFIQQVNHQGFLFIQDLTLRGFTTPGVPFLAGIHWDNAAMVLIFGITTFFTQKLAMADPNDPMQKQMLYTMPFMITAMFVFIPLPSGVLLYTLISNFFTLGQYMLLKRMYPTTALPVPAGEQIIDVKSQPMKPGGNSKKGS
jgi:YidC/Oxa1 family membrane protein insertase